jgi:chromosome segregation ATPase
MKKILIGCFCLAALASCNVKSSSEYKTLEAQRDSLAQINAQNSGELTEMMDIINDVEENFNKIKEAEKYLTIESASKGEMSNNTKSRIRDNFQMINEILEKNKKDLDNLNQRLKASGNQNASLNKMVARLNKELEEKNNTIVELQETLAKRDAQIAELQVAVQELTQNIETMTEQTEQQISTIKEQDKMLNTAYYMFGTSKELKEAKVVSGGFLTSNKVLSENIEKSKFLKVDIRDTKSIPVYAKKAKVLSEHPKDSYAWEKDATDNMVLKISDYQKFWSLTKFLIIEVN